MFEKEEKIKPKDAETIIGAGVKVEGTFVSFGDVIVKGEVSGSVETKNNLRVEKGALINADVGAKNAYISGEIKGNVKVDEKVVLTRTAKISGDISCQSIAIEEGAIFNGRCQMKKEESEIVVEEEKEEE